MELRTSVLVVRKLKKPLRTSLHVYPDVVQNRNAQRIILQTKLERIRTPTKIQHAILDGIQQWESATNSLTHVIQAPYRGTVLPTDCILVQAFLEQSNEIGWDHLLRGRLSLKWSKAYQFYCTKPHQELVSATPWATKLIIHLWEYSSELWKFRNGVNYGHTQAEAIERELAHLCEQVSVEFSLYHSDPFIISPQFNHLYHSKDHSERHLMGRDSLNCWLRSIQEAKKHQATFRSSLTKLSARNFFTKRKNQGKQLHHQHIHNNASAKETPPSIVRQQKSLDDKKILHEIDHG
jgi:hypothetical protein